MSNPAKQQGRRWQTDRIASWMDAGVAADVLGEKGSNDEGDTWVVVPPPLDEGQGFVEEDKCTQRLSVDSVLEKSVDKAGHPRVLLAWKRMRGSKSQGRRSSYQLVAMTPECAQVLVRCHTALHEDDPELVERFWQDALPNAGRPSRDEAKPSSHQEALS